MNFFYMLRDLTYKISDWRKKPRIVYMNADDTPIQPLGNTALSPQPAQSVPTAQSVPISSDTDMMTSTATNNDEAAGVGIAEAQAVATGVDQKQPQGRKSRVRKTNATPRAAVVKKKAPKAPRNPFRRSETGKLQLKSLQMTKRVATMAPRVAVLRERLETMESRMEFISGKLVLVKEELCSRSGTAGGDEAPETAADDMEVSEDIALDNELE